MPTLLRFAVVLTGERGLAEDVGPFDVNLQSGNPARPQLSMDELTRVARSITVADDIDDPRTWIPFDQAIPAN